MAGVVAMEPVARYRWSTGDPEAATEYLRATYTDFRPTSVPADGFAFWTQHASAGRLSISRLRYSPTFETRVQPPSTLQVVQTLGGGRYTVRDGEREVGGSLKLSPTWSEYDATWEDSTAQIVVLDQAEVARVGAELSGLDPSAVAFTSSAPVSPALADYWCRLSTQVHDEVLASDTLMSETLVRANAVRGLAVALLATFPNTVLDALADAGTQDDGQAEPATVRRAVEFMDGHAQDDIGLTEIAAAARIGARSLQLAFRRHRDTTPLEYLRRVRLDGAHRELLAADPTRGDRVETIAARWGFGHPGRFSVIYRECYGRSPSATLRR
jgi:AraC-like DNA-binding protein